MVLLVAGLGLMIILGWRLTQPTPSVQADTASAAPRQTAVLREPEPAAKTRNSALSRKAESAQASQVIAGVNGMPSVLSFYSTPPAQKPFPMAGDIRTGQSRTAILAAYGWPDLRATGIDIGELIERFVYVDKSSGRYTYLLLLNGIVAQADTTGD